MQNGDGVKPNNVLQIGFLADDMCPLTTMYAGFFFFKQKTAYEVASCLVGSEMCIRAGLHGYLILFATHAFELQRQLQTR